SRRDRLNDGSRLRPWRDVRSTTFGPFRFPAGSDTNPGMRTTRARAVLLIAVAVVIATAAFDRSSATPTTAAQAPVAGQYIVVLPASLLAPLLTIHSMRSQLGLQLNHVYTTALDGFAARLSDAQVLALARNPLVQSVTPDRYVAITDQTLPKGVDRIDA